MLFPELHVGLARDVRIVRLGRGQKVEKAFHAEPEPTILDLLAEWLCRCGKREGQ